MTDIFSRLRSAARKRAEYRRTFDELARLPRQSAEDLGIDPQNIREVAHRAVYGN
ncbi:MAG: hypothetical protein AAF667_05295 [Pseudomonadota bacterium]